MAATVSLARLLELPENLQAEVVTRVRRRVLRHLLLATTKTRPLALMGLTSISSTALMRCPVGVSRPLPLPSVTRLNVTTAFSDVLSDLLGCNPAFVGRLGIVEINKEAIVDARTISMFRDVPSMIVWQTSHPGVVDMFREMSRFTSIRRLDLYLGEDEDEDGAGADVDVGTAAALALVSRNTSLEHLDIVWRPATYVSVAVSEFSSLKSLGVTGCSLHWQDLLMQLQPLRSLTDLRLCVEAPLLRESSPQHDGITGLTCLLQPDGDDTGTYVEEICVLAKAVLNVRNLRLDPVGIQRASSTYDVFSAWGRHCTGVESLSLNWLHVAPVKFCAALHMCFGRLTTLMIAADESHGGDFEGMLCFLASKPNLQAVTFSTKHSPSIERVADTVMELFRRPRLFVFQSGWESDNDDDDV